MKAAITTVRIGLLEVEGLMLENGSYAIAVPQIAELNLVPPNRSIKQLETLLGFSFQSHKCSTKLNPKAVNVVSLDTFLEIIKVTSKQGNKAAQSLTDVLLGLSLVQLFSDAFGVKFEKEERQDWLMARQSGKVARRTLTDAIKDYLIAHPEQSDNYKRFIYSNCADTLYRAMLGKRASDIAKERGVKNVRDSLNASELSLIDRLEGHAAMVIDRGLEPGLAVKDALEFYAKMLAS